MALMFPTGTKDPHLVLDDVSNRDQRFSPGWWLQPGLNDDF